MSSNNNDSGVSKILLILGTTVTIATGVLNCTKVGLEIKKDLFGSTEESVYKPHNESHDYIPNNPIIPEQPTTTTVTLNYRGDLYNCSLPLSITIGNVTFTPTGNLFRQDAIPLGNQIYYIQGTISCINSGGMGSCVVSSKGEIFVKENANFFIMWKNRDNLNCDVFLTVN